VLSAETCRVGAERPKQVRAGRRCLAPQGEEKNPRAASRSLPLCSRGRSRSARVLSDSVYLRIWAANIACVPHSDNATTRARGNAA